MASYWLYAPEVDEAGCVADGDTPEEALKYAQDSLHWYPDPGAEIQCYELGAATVLYVPKRCHVCDSPYGDDKLCDCEVESRMDQNQ